MNSCQKPERDNTWDELARLNPEEWMPQDLKVRQSAFMSKSLAGPMVIKRLKDLGLIAEGVMRNGNQSIRF